MRGCVGRGVADELGGNEDNAGDGSLAIVSSLRPTSATGSERVTDVSAATGRKRASSAEGYHLALPFPLPFLTAGARGAREEEQAEAP